jgi:hypothetical protein
LLSNIIDNIFEKAKDITEASVKVVSIIDRFFSQGKNRDLVDHLVVKIFNAYEPDIKLLAQGMPDRIVESLFTLKVISPNDFLQMFADLRIT